MLIVGLTGGYASGKSTVAGMFAEMGTVIIDADILARKVVEPGKSAWNKIVEHFGEKVLNEDKTLNRKTLGEIVFNDETERKRLESIIHPRVLEEEQKAIYEIRKKDPEAIVILSVPLLIESGHHKICDRIVVVTVDEQTHIQRLVKRDDFSREEAIKRISTQMPLSEKVKYADFVIDNSGSLEETKRQVRKIFANFMQRA